MKQYYYHICKNREEQIQFLTYLDALGYKWDEEPSTPSHYIPAEHYSEDQEIYIKMHPDKYIYYGSMEYEEPDYNTYKPFPYNPNPYDF